MVWTPGPLGTYERPMGEVEKPMLAAITSERSNPREPVKIHCFAEFRCPGDLVQVQQAFRSAWISFRLFKSPDIATTFDGEMKKYKISTMTAIDSWADDTFLVAKNDGTIEGIVKQMQNRFDPLPILYLVPSKVMEDSTFHGTLILFISHWRTEASGAFQILDQVLKLATDHLAKADSHDEDLSNYSIGSEVSFLTPTLEEMFPPRADEASKTRVESFMTQHFSNYPPLSFPSTNDGSATPSSTGFRRTVYSSSSTSDLITACKKKGLTINAVVHAAYLGAVWQVAPHKDRSYACIMPAQTRKRLPSSSPYRNQACWNAVKLLFLSAPPGQDLITRAKHLRQQYTQADSEAWLHQDLHEETEAMVKAASRVPPAPSSLPYFTACGKLDGDIITSDHGSIVVEDVYVWADPSNGPGVVFGVWSFLGKLSIEGHFNTAYYRTEDIDAVLESMRLMLQKGLGLEKELDLEKRVNLDF